MLVLILSMCLCGVAPFFLGKLALGKCGEAEALLGR